MNEIYFEKKEHKESKEIFRGEHKEFTFKVLSLGSHPTAYILIPKKHMLFNVNYDNIHLNVHGELTYANTEKDGNYWIGWDYTHCGDYSYFPQIKHSLLSDGKKWTKEEIIRECKKAIEQLINLRKFQKEEYYYASIKD